MTIRFERPVGAHLDVKELEYLAALHQSANTLRADASVTSDDVINFLISRHGVQADKELVENRLMPGLAGAMGENPSAVFDIVELVTILVIPQLKKAADSGDDMETQQLFGKVLKMILSDVYGSENREPPQLDHETMALILETYGEVDVPPQVIDEMLASAGVLRGGETEGVFDVNTLVKAATSDLSRYNNEWSDKFTTHYDDVFYGTSLDKRSSEIRKSVVENLKEDEKENENSIRKLFSLASIDYVAENYTSKAFVTLLWLLLVMLFFVYFLQLQESLAGRISCDRFSNEFSCRVANAVVTWLMVFVQLSAMGTTFVVLASAGTSVYSRAGFGAVILVFIGVCAVVLASICTYAFDGDYVLFEINKVDGLLNDAGYTMCLVVGIILILMHLKKLAFILVPKTLSERIPGSSIWLIPGMAKAERATKRAADYKIEKMIENSMMMHEPVEGTFSSSVRMSTRSGAGASGRGAFGVALMNFQATQDEREDCGGVMWAYRKIWNGSIFQEDGVWIHSRLIASNFAQYFVALFYIFVGVTVLTISEELFEGIRNATSSPTPVPAFEANTTGLDPFVQDMLSWTSETFPLLAQQDAWFLFQFWGAVDPQVAAQIGIGLLSYSSEDIVRAIANFTEPNALYAFVDTAVNVLNDFNVTLPQRRLEEIYVDSPYGDSPYVDSSGPWEATSSGNHGRRLEDFLEEITPERWQYLTAFGLGGLAAVGVTLAVAIIWIPSAISTILQFRSGVIGSLRDRDFQQYRVAPDVTSILLGSTFWGIVYCSGAIFAIVGGVLFFILWDITQPIFVAILAQVIGIVVTLLAKIIVLIFLRKVMFTGLYRKQPAVANLTLVILECWSLGLTVGTMFARLLKLLLVSAFYIARIDTPMVAKGVGNIGPIALDGYPIQFRKDLVVHDAHRHPYMERLGVIYMLKLRHGEEFGTRSGSAWRLIIVMALMPWLRRYRLDEDEKEDSLEKAIEGGGEIKTHDDNQDDLFKLKLENERLRQLVKKLEKKLAVPETVQETDSSPVEEATG